MSENRRRSEVPEEEVPVVECLDGLARITSKELAITHFVKDGTLQNACSTSPRKDADLVRSALMRIKFTKAVSRHADIRDRNPSLAMTCPDEPHQRNPKAPKFEETKTTKNPKPK